MGKILMLLLSVLACAAMATAAFLALPHLSAASLPVHWNGQGRADNFAPARTVLYAFPVIAAVLSAAFLLAVPSTAPAARAGRLSSAHVLAWGLGLGIVALLQSLTLLNALR
jgi:hypothetical protein